MPRGKKKHTQHNRLKRIMLGSFLAVTTAGLLALAVLLAYIAFWPFEARPQQAASYVLAADGSVLSSIFVENRRPVSIQDISPYFLESVIAVEDARFFQHRGIDFIRLGRVVAINLRERAPAQGASTITQQLARNMFLTLEKRLDRKIHEAIIALQLEYHYSKEDILELYVNQIYMGHGLYGIQNAARFYYGIDAADLNLAQSSMLAGLIQLPEVFSPVNNFPAARSRQRIVLHRLVAVGAISAEDAQQAYDDEAAVTPVAREASALSAGYVRQAVISYLSNNYLNGSYHAYRGGLSVQTTIDRQLQLFAEEAVREGLEYLEGRGALRQDLPRGQVEVALVALDPRTGHIKAMVGGRDYQQSTFNRVYAKRPPGSSFKPLLYAEALRTGTVNLATTMLCAHVSFPIPGHDPWEPKDFGGTYHDAELTIRQALVESDNVIAAKLMHQIGPASVISLAQSLGMRLDNRDAVLSLALGTRDVTPLELAAAFAAFANGGYRVQPTLIGNISDQTGRVWEEARHPAPVQVLDERIAFLVSDVLKDVITEGTGRPILQWYRDPRAAAKTGTTDVNGRINNAWIAGYTPDLVTVVYIGADDYSQPITNRTDVGGGGLAGAIWGRFMAKAANILPRTEEGPVPDGIVVREVCVESGQLATNACPADKRREEYFLAEFIPLDNCQIHSAIPTPPAPEQREWWRIFIPNLPR